jgi:uncharacterized repeat protein (TIGR03803 family)
MGKLNCGNWMIRACGLLLLCAMTGIALPAQTFTTLRNFDGKNGAYPCAGLVQGANGNLYGTTHYGGTIDVCSNSFGDGCGAVFKITPSGTLTAIHSFDGTDGEALSSVLVQAANGDFYGTTYEGGSHGIGTVFKITPGGMLTTLHSFDGGDGGLPKRDWPWVLMAISTGRHTKVGPTPFRAGWVVARSLKLPRMAH